MLTDLKCDIAIDTCSSKYLSNFKLLKVLNGYLNVEAFPAL